MVSDSIHSQYKLRLKNETLNSLSSFSKSWNSNFFVQIVINFQTPVYFEIL